MKLMSLNNALIRIVVVALALCANIKARSPLDEYTYTWIPTSDTLSVKTQLAPEFMSHRNRSVVYQWCPVCEDSTSKPTTININKLRFADAPPRGLMFVRLNGKEVNIAKLWVYQGDSIWENLLHIVNEDRFPSKIIPPFIKGPGEASMARIAWTVPLPHGETMYAIYGKQLEPAKDGKEAVLFDNPAIYIENFNFWSDPNIEETMPTLLGSFHDTVTGNKYVAIQHNAPGNATAGCGELTVFKSASDGPVGFLGSIPNPKCIPEWEWVVDSVPGGGGLAGVMLIHEKMKTVKKGKTPPAMVYAVGPQGIVQTQMPASPKKTNSGKAGKLGK